MDRAASFLCPIYLPAFSLPLSISALEAATATPAAVGMYEALLSCQGDE